VKENSIATKKLLQWLMQNSKKAKGQAIANITIGITDVICQLLWVIACKHAIDIATGVTEGSLMKTGIIIGALMIIEIILRAIRRWIHAVTGNKIRNSLRLRTFTRLMKCDWLHLYKRHTGDLVNRLEGDVNSITTLVTEIFPATIVVLIQLLASFGLLFYMNPVLAMSVVVVLPICILASRFYVSRMRKFNRDVRNSDSNIQSILQESLQRKEVIKAMEHTGCTEQHLNELQDKQHEQISRRTRFSIGSFTLIQAGFAVGYLIAFMWGVAGLRDAVITYGTMAAYLQLVGLIQNPTMDLSQYIPGIASSLTAVERLCELEAIPLEQQGENIILKKGAGARFSNVTFSYEEKSRKILNNFSYDFPPESTTAIVGETGAGKTTLLRLLIALATPNKGSIELYNEEEQYIASPTTRGNIVYIPQGNTLISGTIRENLLMGNPEATEEQMKKALHIACSDYVLKLPDGLDSVITEGGGGVSEGQAQRISIARSLLRPGSILIFDEATSALDEETEQELLKRLTQEKIGKTLIFVTHRPAVIKHCTQILKIERTKL
jgi:ABC-type multidrug transport system fused ATPase/permease subunit